MPASEFAQKQVGVVTWTGDVVKDRGAAHFAGVVDDQIAKTEESLRNAGGNGDVLNFRERNVARRASDQASVNLDF